jgi:acyl carrier protein
MDVNTLIRAIVARKLLFETDSVIPEARLVEDLGADSLNILEIVLDINELLDIEISTDGLAGARRVGDLYDLAKQALHNLESPTTEL